jgi:hypothetical protein
LIRIDNEYLILKDSFLAGSFYPFKMQFEVTKADSHKRTQNNSIEVLIPEELQVRVLLKIDIETSVSVDESEDFINKKIFISILETGQILLRTYSTMMANEIMMNTQENSFDSILENAQRTVFLKELFAQVNFLKKFSKSKILGFLALSRSIGYYEYYSTNGYEKFNSMLGLF